MQTSITQKMQRYTGFIKDWFVLGDAQAYIVSYPKSGRTWLRALVGKALCDHYGLSEDLLLDTYNLTGQAGVLKTRFIHDRTDLLVGLHYRRLPRRKPGFRRRKVALLLRDPRDLMVSCYFQATKRINVFHGSISEFIRSDRYGIRKYAHFVNTWYANQLVPRDFLLLTYEDIHADPHGVLCQLLAFLGAPDVSDSTLEAAVAYASFDSMKKLEAKDRFDSDKLRPADSGDPESYKVRKGKVGGYKAYLSEDDVATINGIVAQVGCPFLESYYPPDNATA
jgi:hypothetical protein